MCMAEREPPNLDEPEKMDEYWEEDTTITVPRYVKWSLNEHRDGKPWGRFLEELRKQYADPMTMNDGQQIVEFLESELETIANNASMAPENPESAADEIGESIDLILDRLAVIENKVEELPQ